MDNNKIGGTSINSIKTLFKAQWVNGDIKTYMESVKRRVEEVHNIILEFTNEDEFIDELLKHGLIEIIKKPKQKD